MGLNFNVIKDKLKMLWLGKDHYHTSMKNTNETPTLSPIDDDSVLLNAEKYENNFTRGKPHVKLTSMNVLEIKYLPLIYGILSVSSILLMFISSFVTSHLQNLYNFFYLNHINPLTFHLVNLAISLCGLTIILSYAYIIKIKMSQSFLNDMFVNKLKFYVSVICGIKSNLIQAFSGITLFLDVFRSINSNLIQELNVNLSELLFGAQMLFSILFGMLAINLIYTLNSNKIISETNKSMYQISQYQILFLIYTILITFSYVIIYFSEQYSKEHNSSYTLLKDILPYCAYLSNTAFWVMFYVEFKSYNILFTQIKEKSNYEDNQKNIL